MTTEAFAPAKINLTLHVIGQRVDGYHLLDSLVAFADVGDRLTVAPAAALTLSVTGPRAFGVPTDDSNLVMKAARLLNADKGAALMLEKHLPAAAGIGGGSSDAAAALRALCALWGLPVPKDTLALGADVPVCMTPKPVRMTGIGGTLLPISPLPPLPAVLVNPLVSITTPAVFQSLESKANPPMPETPESWGSVADVIAWLATQRNDLEPPARALCPQIDMVLAALQPARLARMSGSGATCFGLFETADQAKAAAASIAQAHPDWWVAATCLGTGLPAGQLTRSTT